MRIAIVGCGTTGNFVLPFFRGKEVFVVDRDIVEERNLERQPLFTMEDIGKPKAEMLGRRFGVRYVVEDIDASTISLLDEAGLIIDCTDNLETRFLLNEYCHKRGIPWVYTGVVGARGRVMAVTGEFCFRCVFSEVKGLDTCATVGVDLEMVQRVAEVAADEVSRVLHGKKSRGLWANGEWVTISRKKGCPVCAGTYSSLNQKKERLVTFCGSSRYQFRGAFDFENVKKRFGGNGGWFVFEDFYVFRDRVVVKAENEKEARKKVAEVIGV